MDFPKGWGYRTPGDLLDRRAQNRVEGHREVAAAMGMRTETLLRKIASGELADQPGGGDLGHVWIVNSSTLTLVNSAATVKERHHTNLAEKRRQDAHRGGNLKQGIYDVRSGIVGPVITNPSSGSGR